MIIRLVYNHSRFNYGTDNHGNKCLSGIKEATQHTSCTNGGLSKENSSGNTGQVTDAQDICLALNISKRALQILQDEKAMPYTSVTAVGSKLLYPESGLYEVLKKSYKDFKRYLK